MSSWLGGSKQIAVGRIVRYRTHERHEEDGWSYAQGTFCFATRTPAGELGLFFFQEGLEHGDIARALWLPAEYGLCGVEPGVLDPELRNMAMVNQTVQEADARVMGELRAEAEAEAVGRPPSAVSFGSGEKEIALEPGGTVKAHWKVIEAHVAPVKKIRKPAKKKRRKKT